jgi:hypothetical protein
MDQAAKRHDRTPADSEWMAFATRQVAHIIGRLLRCGPIISPVTDIEGRGRNGDLA